ncbi:MAG TPA: hydrogenase nickel incorporation protein HypB [Kiritimatiellia bacterium]|nr:hydrogenase nickel incorporation protein HypB [Kiritimatiellia bacterium]
MCATCGCSQPTGPHHHHHGHHHDHDHGPHHLHPDPSGSRVVNLAQSLLAQNDRFAEQNRGILKAHHILAANLMSSPGSGKTALLERTLADLMPELRIAVIVGDLATENDAARLRKTGAPAHQIMTGTACHLDAHAVQHAFDHLDLPSLHILFIENVGNLVCPASFDLGERLKVVVMSVTEGEDKPLKYPSMFQRADIVLINKIDLAHAAGYHEPTALANLKSAAPQAQIIPCSAKTGQGMDQWYNALRTHLPPRNP